MSMTANRFAGIRAALCRTLEEAQLSREHNDANVLCLSGDLVDAATNESIVNAWLETEFEGGRHGRRVAKIGPFVLIHGKSPEFTRLGVASPTGFEPVLPP